MKKILMMILLISLSQCATGPVSGFIFTMNKFAGEVNVHHTGPATKKAEGCVHWVLGLVSVGDASVGQIAYRNKIQRISHVDHSTMSALTLIYQNYCTIVYGE